MHVAKWTIDSVNRPFKRFRRISDDSDLNPRFELLTSRRKLKSNPPLGEVLSESLSPLTGLFIYLFIREELHRGGTGSDLIRFDSPPSRSPMGHPEGNKASRPLPPFHSREKPKVFHSRSRLLGHYYRNGLGKLL